jgi:hypothetical protein
MQTLRVAAEVELPVIESGEGAGHRFRLVIPKDAGPMYVSERAAVAWVLMAVVRLGKWPLPATYSMPLKVGTVGLAREEVPSSPWGPVGFTKLRRARRFVRRQWHRVGIRQLAIVWAAAAIVMVYTGFVRDQPLLFTACVGGALLVALDVLSRRWRWAHFVMHHIPEGLLLVSSVGMLGLLFWIASVVAGAIGVAVLGLGFTALLVRERASIRSTIPKVGARGVIFGVIMSAVGVVVWVIIFRATE